MQTENSTLPTITRELKSTVADDGTVTLGLREADVAAPGPDEVVVRIEAAPINPSDLGMLFANADMATAKAVGTDEFPAVQATIPTGTAGLEARLGRAMPTGNEGGGTVIAAGESDAAQALLGKVVGFLSGNAYAEYRTVNAASCLPMHDGTDPADAAACFVNPLTALGMVETMRAEGHTALVHTVGASNLGQMLNRICLADGVELVNIVRKQEQVDLLTAAGAKHVVNSSADTFRDDLYEALRATGATITFDAIGGGDLGSTILATMEQVASAGDEFARYGSNTFKQLYLYGGLDRSPTLLHRNFGMSWSVGAWLLTPFLMKAGKAKADELRTRVADEITTTFASHYGMRLSLDEAVDPEQVKRYSKVATGEKALITPG